MKFELGKRFSAVKKRAGEMANTGIDRAKDTAGKAKSEVQSRAKKAVDGNARLADIRDKTEKFQTQTKLQLDKVRATIAAAKNDPKDTVSTAKDVAISVATPHVQKVSDAVKTHATQAQNTIKQKTGEVRTGIESRAVGLFAHGLLRWAGNPETLANLRKELSDNLPGMIITKAQEVNGKGLSPQRQLRETLAPDGLNGINAPVFEAVAFAADRATVFSGWLVANALTRYLLLPEGQEIKRTDVNSIITGNIVAPTIRFVGQTAGTIYNRAQSAIKSRFSSGQSPTATVA